MKNLEKIIEENRQDFDDLEPDEKHFNKFKNKMEAKQKRKNKITFRSLLRVAAIIGFILISSTIIYSYHNNKIIAQSTEQGLKLQDLSPEYKEVEAHLQSNVNEKIDALEKLECTNSDIEKDEILNELNEIDTMYVNLQKELLQNKNDERIINAMINCYQMKAEVLEQIIKQANDNC